MLLLPSICMHWHDLHHIIGYNNNIIIVSHHLATANINPQTACISNVLTGCSITTYTDQHQPFMVAMQSFLALATITYTV